MFNPNDYFSSKIFADFILSLGDLGGKYILDMGCGSGIVSVFAASRDARCLAVDVNPVSVKTTEENAMTNGFKEKINTLQSDLFEHIPAEEKFDMIFFNPPYYEKEPQTDFEKAFFTGKDFRVIRKFLQRAGGHLAPEGTIYFITSSDLNINLFLNMVRAGGFEFNIIKKVNTLFETFYITKAFLNTTFA